VYWVFGVFYGWVGLRCRFWGNINDIADMGRRSGKTDLVACSSHTSLFLYILAANLEAVVKLADIFHG